MNTKHTIAAIPLALAASLALPAAAFAAPGDWAGPYIGLNAGYGQDKSVTLDYAGGFSSSSFDMTGWMGGGQVGYNWAIDGVVLGVQADASAADVSGENSCPNLTWSCRAKMDQLYKIQGRVGFTVHKALLYASLGAASAQIEAKTLSPLGAAFSDSSYQTGWLAGIGAGMAFNNHWNGFVEAQYLDFGSNDYTVDFGNIVSVDNKFVTLGVGLNYKF